MLGFVERLLSGGMEKRFHPKEESQEWYGSLGGWTTDAGITITPDNAIGITAVFACIRILAETLAMLPLQAYQKQKRGRRPADEFYLDRILSEEPNPEMTSFEYRETLMGHLGSWGNAYSEIDWDQSGRVRALWPIPPNRIDDLRRVNGELVYTIRLAKPDEQGRIYRDLAGWRIWHLRGLGSNGLVGYSPIRLFRESLGLTRATEEFGARFFGNGAQPGMVLTHPGKLDESVHKRLKTSWEESHQGLKNSHRVAILEEGIQVEKIGIPPEDAQFLATRKFQLSEVARIYRIQPHKIGDLEHATFSNIEHQAIEFVVDTMLPWLVRWEKSAKRALMLPSERQAGYYLKFNAEGLLRGDTLSRYQAHAVARQWGWLSANDVREREDQNPIEGGDIYMMPLNMVPVGGEESSSGKAAPGDPEEKPEANSLQRSRLAERSEVRANNAANMRHRLQGRYRGLFEETLSRILRRERNDVLAQAKKQLRSNRSLSDFQNWLDDFYRQHEDFVFDAMLPLYGSYGDAVLEAVNTELGEAGDPDFAKFLRSYTGSFARRYSRKQLLNLQALLEKLMAEKPADEILAAFEAELDDWVSNRPADYAFDESVRSNNGIAKHLYVLAGVSTLRWVTVGKSCPYCESLDGMEISIKSWFLEPGEFQPDGADAPLTVTSSVGHAPAHGGCDCMTMAGS